MHLYYLVRKSTFSFTSLVQYWVAESGGRVWAVPKLLLFSASLLHAALVKQSPLTRVRSLLLTLMLCFQ